MRLLNTNTLELEEYSDNIPRYAILSHVWGEEEIVYDDVKNGKTTLLRSTKKGLRKLMDSCETARNDDHRHIWIDTCCIDKSSSEELSTAINSMFSWYESADVCYAYLDDYYSEAAPTLWEHSDSDDMTEHQSRLSYRWFTRGWTLQELLAPFDVLFLNANWKSIGNRFFLAEWISEQTGISKDILRRHVWDECGRRPRATMPNKDGDLVMCCSGTSLGIGKVLASLSISTRMKWAARRVTTRPEDLAYCLMGIFQVNMPLLYGEGHRAFPRLQEAIVKAYCDQTIFAWGSPSRVVGDFGKSESVFAHLPSDFRNVLPLVSDQGLNAGVYFSDVGVEFEGLLGSCTLTYPESLGDGDRRTRPADNRCRSVETTLYFAVLGAHILDDPLGTAAILLEEVRGARRTFVRVRVLDQMVFALRDWHGKSYTWYDPINPERRIRFDLEKVEKKWILMGEEREVLTGPYSPLRVHYGNGASHYHLSHSMPSFFQTGWSQYDMYHERHSGLLCFTTGSYVVFFVCWVQITRSESTEIHCSIHSPEELLGKKGHIRESEVPASEEDFYWKAKSVYDNTYLAVRDRLDYPTSAQVQIPEEIPQLISVRVQRVSFMGRECFQIVIEEVANTVSIEILSEDQEAIEDDTPFESPDEFADMAPE